MTYLLSVFLFSLKWHGAKPRTPIPIFSQSSPVLFSTSGSSYCMVPAIWVHRFISFICIGALIWSLSWCTDTTRLWQLHCLWRFDDCSDNTLGVIYLWLSLWFRSCSTCLFSFLMIDYFTSMDYLGSENRVWLYWIFFMFIVYHFEEIYFRSLFLIQLHVRGFSSQRITSMIHFLSSVCVCVFLFVCFCVSLCSPSPPRWHPLLMAWCLPFCWNP